MARPRAFPEILSAVQGSFDFLQDSEIDTQQKAKKSQEGKTLNSKGDMHMLSLKSRAF